jgi:hypothetical protein
MSARASSSAISSRLYAGTCAERARVDLGKVLGKVAAVSE